jgi:hypothetical protein
MISFNNTNLTNETTKKYLKWYLFSIGSLVFSLICFFLFYNQIYSKNDYLSDVKAHIKFSIYKIDNQPAGYSLLHSLVDFFANKVSNFAYIDLQSAANLGMAMLLTFAVFFTILIIKNYFDDDVNVLNLKTMMLTITTMLVSMIIVALPGAKSFVYLGVGTPNPWHNPTFLICRPFSLLVFLLFIMVFNQAFNKRINYLQYIALGVFAILSMWFKPSFMMSFLPTIALIVLYNWYKAKIDFGFIVKLIFTFLPAVVIIVIVYKFVYQSQTSNAISFAPGAYWYLYSKSVLFSLLLGMLFPIYVFILKIKNLSLEFKIAGLNFLIAFIIAFLFTETGDRAAHGNLFWTYMFAMFFMFLVATKSFFLESKFYIWQRILGYMFYAAHLFSGIIYFIYIFKGKAYF